MNEKSKRTKAMTRPLRTRKGQSFQLFFTLYTSTLVFCLALVILSFFGAPNLLSLILMGLFIVLLVIAVIVFCAYKRGIRSEVLQTAIDLNMQYLQVLSLWEEPVVLFSQEGKVLWCNTAFRVLSEEDVLGKRMEDIGFGLEGERTHADQEPIFGHVVYSDRHYFYMLQALSLTEPTLKKKKQQRYTNYMLTLHDETNEVLLQQENKDLQPAVIEIWVDNYDRIIDGMEEKDKPLVISKIYQAIADLSDDIDAVLVQPEDDRYFIAFHQNRMEKLLASKFKVLDDVRQINTGENVPITLSIGVGCAYQMEEAFDRAKSCVQLAMSRGGDQAVVKTEEETKYFGGHSSTLEQDSHVRTRYMATRMEELIREAENVIIMGHKIPDMDAMGASLGLYRMAKLLGTPAYLVQSENMQACKSLYDRIMSQSNADDLFIDENDAIRLLQDKNVLLIVTDVNVPMLVESELLLEKASGSETASIAVIDHHRAQEKQITPATLSYIETSSSSSSEMVTEIMEFLSVKTALTDLEADALLCGICLDTKFFTFRAGVRTFEAAAYLRRQGADIARVRSAFKQSFEEFKTENDLASKAERLNSEALFTYWETDNENWRSIAASVADDLLGLSGVELSFSVTETDQMIYVSGRSNGKINVQRVLENIPQNEETGLISAGGNLMTAAAQFKKTATIDSVKECIIDSINEIKEEKA